MAIKLLLKKTNNGVKFFVLVCFLYLFIGIVNYTAFENAMVAFLNMAIRVLPLLLFVFFFMVFINLYFTKKRTQKYFGHDSGLKAWMYAVISGILISGPPYVLYPMLGELKKRGMKNSLLAVFLYNRNVKIPFLPVLVFYFGLEYSIFFSVYIILFSIANGFLIQAFVSDGD